MIERRLSQELVADLKETEELRCSALAERDWDSLRRILADDFAYHHWHGRTDSREDWIRHLQGYVSYRTDRSSMRVDLYGDTAVVVGVLTNTIVKDAARSPSMSVISAVQVWSCGLGTWRQRAHYSFKTQP